MAKSFTQAIKHPFQQLAQTVGRNKKARNVILGFLTLTAAANGAGLVSDVAAAPAGNQASISMDNYANVNENNRFRVTFFETSKHDRPATVISLEDKGQDIIVDRGRGGQLVTPKQSTITLQKQGATINGMYDTSTYRMNRLYEVHIPFTIQNVNGKTILTASPPVSTDQYIASDYSPNYGGTAPLNGALQEIRAGLGLYNQQSGAELRGGISRPASVGSNTILDQTSERGRASTIRRSGDTNNFEVAVTTKYTNKNFPGGMRTKNVVYTPARGGQHLNDWVLQEHNHLMNTQPSLPFNRLPTSLKDEYSACTHILAALEASRMSHPNGYALGQDPFRTGQVTYLDSTNFTPQGGTYSYGGRPSNSEWPILEMKGSRIYEDAKNERNIRSTDDFEHYVLDRFKAALDAIGPSGFTKPQPGAAVNGPASVDMKGYGELKTPPTSSGQAGSKPTYQRIGVPAF